MEDKDLTPIISLVDLYGGCDRPADINDSLVSDSPEPDFNSHPLSNKIIIPERFTKVVLKLFPEIKNIVCFGVKEIIKYEINTNKRSSYYLVGVDLYFNKKNRTLKTKKEYSDEMNDYFKMTFVDMDFVTFHVREFILPSDKTNSEKFIELFGIK
jgi:hypothetical protein